MAKKRKRHYDDPLRHPDHARPVTRRDFLAQGFITGSAFATSGGVLAVLCEAYTEDPNRPSQVFMKFHPRVAPIKAAIFPLVAKDGMPEMAQKLYEELRHRYAVQLDIKQAIGKRYARMDEAGTPYCFTIDGDSLSDQTVTVRERDTLAQERIAIDKVGEFLQSKIES